MNLTTSCAAETNNWVTDAVFYASNEVAISYRREAATRIVTCVGRSSGDVRDHH